MKKSLYMLASTALVVGVQVQSVAQAQVQAATTAAAIGAAGTGGTLATAASACLGTAQKNTIYGGSGNPVTTGALFIKTGFDVQCSNNVLMQLQEVSANAGAVASGSLKGNQSFSGHSNGGAITARAKCTGTNDQCVTANVATALTTAVTEASSN